MKAYTDVEQSKKLTEILPLESADTTYDWERSESVGYTILKQAIKDNADLINERVKETISVYDFGNREEIKEAIEDSVHSYIAEKLFNEKE